MRARDALRAKSFRGINGSTIRIENNTGELTAQFHARDSRLKLSYIAGTVQFKYEPQRKELCD